MQVELSPRKTFAPFAVRRSVLFLAQSLPLPLDTGPRVRAHGLIAWLAARFDVHLLAFESQVAPPDAAERMRELCAEVHTVAVDGTRPGVEGELMRAMLPGKTSNEARAAARAMAETAERLASETDFAAVHAEGLWMAPYVHDLPVPFKVLGQYDAAHRLFRRLTASEVSVWRRWVLDREAARLARYEAAQVEAFHHLVFTTEDARAAVHEIGSEAQQALLAERGTVVPLGLDVAGGEPVAARDDAHRVTVVGAMDGLPNVEGVRWLAEAVWPRIAKGRPDAALTVLGPRPHPDIRALEATLGEAIEVLPDVADVRPVLEETAVLAVPLSFASGPSLPLLEGWAWGLPVVATPAGAAGVAVAPDRDVLVADGPEAFADAVLALLSDPVRRANIGNAGRASALARHDTSVAHAPLDDVYGPALA